MLNQSLIYYMYNLVFFCISYIPNCCHLWSRNCSIFSFLCSVLSTTVWFCGGGRVFWGPFSFWSLYCLFFFKLQLLITMSLTNYKILTNLTEASFLLYNLHLLKCSSPLAGGENVHQVKYGILGHMFHVSASPGLVFSEIYHSSKAAEVC